MADIAASVLAKLRNKAKASGISYQQCLQLFVQEEFLRKLSKSGCEDTLILKGGLFIYTLTNFESRATIDVDFLLRGYSNTIDDVKELICKIIDTPTGNDYIEMRAKGFEEISPQRKYHGISTQIIAQIKNVRVPFNVDIGVGDIIVPRAEERTINTQLPDFEAPVIKTYSLESTIAEKFDAILQRFELTGRMKDFYDIYYLSTAPLPNEYAKAVVPKDKITTLEQKKFVASIREIKYDKMIPNAMSDYWKADLTVAKYFRDNLMYLESLESYMEDLSAKMQYSKANSDLNAEGATEEGQIRISKQMP